MQDVKTDDTDQLLTFVGLHATVTCRSTSTNTAMEMTLMTTIIQLTTILQLILQLTSAPEVVDDGALYKFTLYLLYLLTHRLTAIFSR